MQGTCSLPQSRARSPWQGLGRQPQLSNECGKTLVDFVKEGFAVNLCLVFELGEKIKVACHNAVLDCLDSSLFELVSKRTEFCVAIEFTSLAECACPCKEGCNGIG